jgi:hypothetical protein
LSESGSTFAPFGADSRCPPHALSKWTAGSANAPSETTGIDGFTLFILLVVAVALGIGFAAGSIIGRWWVFLVPVAVGLLIWALLPASDDSGPLDLASGIVVAVVIAAGVAIGLLVRSAVRLRRESADRRPRP